MSHGADSTTSEKSVSNEKTRGEEQKYGDRLLDDLMNTFCDKLQKSAQEEKRHFEGLLAIQYITKLNRRPFWDWLCCKRLDVENVRKLITGKTRAIQIIFDDERTHYVVVYLNSQKTVVLYDSLNTSDVDTVLTETVRRQIHYIFGHLYEGGMVPLEVELNYERQDDVWSCGYRAIGCVLTLVKGEAPVEHSYDLQAIYRLLMDVLGHEKVQFGEFTTRRISQRREMENRRVSLLLNGKLKYSVSDGEHYSKSSNSSSKTGSSCTDSPTVAVTSWRSSSSEEEDDSDGEN